VVQLIKLVLLGILTACLGGGHVAAKDKSEPYVTISTRNDGNAGATIIAANNTMADITVFLDVKGENIKTSKAVPLTVIVPARSKKNRLLKVSRNAAGRKWRYSYNYEYGFGDASAEHDDKYIYRLPYKAGDSYEVSQSFGGKFSHQKGLHYSVDFLMPEGTPVCAARDGTVVAVKSSSDVGGPSAKFKRAGNYVYVLHADRTLGVYLHFKKGGVSVDPGERVRRGQLIGHSGNTGWSKRPHLHFSVHSVFREDELGKSFPLRFATKMGTLKLLSEGKSYEAK
jgi:murein DD-endopeptidase MepM/ murein hydrolase activator NlpD